MGQKLKIADGGLESFPIAKADEAKFLYQKRIVCIAVFQIFGSQVGKLFAIGCLQIEDKPQDVMGLGRDLLILSREEGFFRHESEMVLPNLKI